MKISEVKEVLKANREAALKKKAVRLTHHCEYTT
jgi:hypothetical protein